jgi:hypothetical protein
VSVTFIQGEPPAGRGKGSTRYERIREQLRANPGVWAEVHRLPFTEQNRHIAGAFAQNVHRSGAGDGIKAISRRVGDEVIVYAMAVRTIEEAPHMTAADRLDAIEAGQ